MDSFIDPNIVKAQFILSNSRIYNLEFDQNIEFYILKSMIQVAAHLKKNNFRLFSEGEEYTQYNDETFDSIFPNKKLVVFTIEIAEKGEFLYETEEELLLQINSSCPEHKEKFLMFYCFDCGISVCSECFIKGKHKGHHIQDKCYYLLPSKFLVIKLFECWKNISKEDFKITADLTQFKDKLNNIFFPKLFQLLKEIQSKCNDLIDEYNNINNLDLTSLRNSIVNIKISGHKTLNELKDKLDIKEIVNNENIFKNFDTAYKELGRFYKEKLKNNINIFNDLNQNISYLIVKYIESIHNNILDNLNILMKDEMFNQIKIKIGEKYIKPINQDDIINFDNSGKIEI